MDGLDELRNGAEHEHGLRERPVCAASEGSDHIAGDDGSEHTADVPMPCPTPQNSRTAALRHAAVPPLCGHPQPAAALAHLMAPAVRPRSKSFWRAKYTMTVGSVMMTAPAMIFVWSLPYWVEKNCGSWVIVCFVGLCRKSSGNRYSFQAPTNVHTTT